MSEKCSKTIKTEKYICSMEVKIEESWKSLLQSEFDKPYFNQTHTMHRHAMRSHAMHRHTMHTQCTDTPYTRNAQHNAQHNA